MSDRYFVEVTDVADVEADAIYLWISEKSTEAAHAWYHGLLAAYQSLSIFPHRFSEVEGLPGTRRMLYGRYRVLFKIVEPTDREDVGIVRIAHVYHASRG